MNDEPTRSNDKEDKIAKGVWGYSKRDWKNSTLIKKMLKTTRSRISSGIGDAFTGPSMKPDAYGTAPPIS